MLMIEYGDPVAGCVSKPLSLKKEKKENEKETDRVLVDIFKVSTDQKKCK